MVSLDASVDRKEHVECLLFSSSSLIVLFAGANDLHAADLQKKMEIKKLTRTKRWVISEKTLRVLTLWILTVLAEEERLKEDSGSCPVELCDEVVKSLVFTEVDESVVSRVSQFQRGK